MKNQKNEKTEMKTTKRVVPDGVSIEYQTQLTKEQWSEMQRNLFSQRIHAIMNRYNIRQSDFVNDGMDKGQVSRWVSGKVMPKQFSIDDLVRYINSRITDKINSDYLTGKSEYMTEDEAENHNRFIELISSRANTASTKRMIFNQLMLIHLDQITEFKVVGGDIHFKDAIVPFNEVFTEYRKEMEWYSKCLLQRIIDNYSPMQGERPFEIDPVTFEPNEIDN